MMGSDPFSHAAIRAVVPSSCKSLTPAVYHRVGELFRQRFGTHAGWGHQLLFAAELQEFRKLLPPSMVLQMEQARQLEKADKAWRR